MRQSGAWPAGGAYLDQRLARAAEADYPDKAILIHLKRAEAAIQMRKRTNYANAAQSLVQVRETLNRTHRSDEWPAIIEGSRMRHTRLPTLRDELNKAGLSHFALLL